MASPLTLRQISSTIYKPKLLILCSQQIRKMTNKFKQMPAWLNNVIKQKGLHLTWRGVTKVRKTRSSKINW